MERSKKFSNQRIARPGDVFLLLVPSAQELHPLREKQLALQSRYGGELDDFIHITCERFSPGQKEEEIFCIDFLYNHLSKLSPFMIYGEQLVQFFAPYWGEEVLRWQVQDTEEYGQLRDVVGASLVKTGCSPHFDRRRQGTCTALRMVENTGVTHPEGLEPFPTPLFIAKHLWVSKLVQENEFEILEKLTLANSSSPGAGN